MYALNPETVIGWNIAFGGDLLDRGKLESALARPLHTFAGQPLYPEPVTQAASLLHALCLNHPFIDGNKRTAWKACTVFLTAREFSLTADPAIAGQLVLDVATGRYGVDDIQAWLIEHLTPSKRCSPPTAIGP